MLWDILRGRTRRREVKPRLSFAPIDEPGQGRELKPDLCSSQLSAKAHQGCSALGSAAVYCPSDSETHGSSFPKG